MQEWTVEQALPKGFLKRLQHLENSNAPPATYLAAFLHLAGALKHSKRTGWLDCGLKHPESIADHMYRMGLISMLTQNKKLDMAKCVQIALAHDLAECLVGDITPYSEVTKSEKHRREEVAMEYLCDLLARFNKDAGALLLGLWKEYENQTSPEAAFVKDIDKFELHAQTLEYKREYPAIDFDGFAHVSSLIKSSEVAEWAKGADQYASS